MSWKQLLANRQIQTHVTNENEIASLKAVVRRDLSDADLPQLSPDRQYATAYSAMLQLAKLVIATSGYRVLARSGHHATKRSRLPWGKVSRIWLLIWIFVAGKETCSNIITPT